MEQEKKFLLLSIILHLLLLSALILAWQQNNLPAVIQQSNQHDVINAVILGDTVQSKILPVEKPIQAAAKKNIQPQSSTTKIAKLPVEVTKSKALALQAKLSVPNKTQLAKQLLADIEKQSKITKKQQQKHLADKFTHLLKKQSELSMRENLLKEDIKLKAEKARYTHGVIAKYQALIIQAISNNWIVPPQVNQHLTCELLIRLAPGGSVLDVQIKKSSGDIALDRSARTAVLKSSPLPVPSVSDEFAAFRSFVLKVKPETVLARD